MGWIKLSDNFLENRKIDSLSPLAKLLYLDGLLYSSRQMTDGFIPKTRVSSIEQIPLVEEILAVGQWSEFGLWDEAEGGYQIHDYKKHQSSKAKIEEVRAKNQQKLALWRDKKRDEEIARLEELARLNETKGETGLQTKGETNGVTTPEYEDEDEVEDDIENQFQKFWELYPRKDGKKAAEEAYKKASKKTLPQIINDGVPRYIAFLKTVTQDTAMPATWINGERWNDEVSSISAPQAPKSFKCEPITPPGCADYKECTVCHQEWPCAKERAKNDNPF